VVDGNRLPGTDAAEEVHPLRGVHGDGVEEHWRATEVDHRGLGVGICRRNRVEVLSGQGAPLR